MTSTEAKQKVQELRNTLQEWADKYYDEDSPVVSDF